MSLQDENATKMKALDQEQVAAFMNMLIDMHTIEAMDDRTLAQTLLSEFEDADNTNRKCAILVEAARRLSDHTGQELRHELAKGIIQ